MYVESVWQTHFRSRRGRQPTQTRHIMPRQDKPHLSSGESVRSEMLSRTQEAAEVKMFMGFSLKLLCSRDPPLLC